MKMYIIKGLRMTNYLIRKGFDLLKVEDDIHNSHYKVFLFEDTPELRQAMSRFKK